MCVERKKVKINPVTEIVFVFGCGPMYPFISQSCELLIYV